MIVKASKYKSLNRFYKNNLKKRKRVKPKKVIAKSRHKI
jgi:hypothetical protein